MSLDPLDSLLTNINEQFGGVRAEYLRGSIFNYFTTPAYWPELLTTRPCFLMGGRGTGKTTVLRGLSFEGQWVLEGQDVHAWRHIGLYWRFDTNVVTAFRGQEADPDTWVRLFGHYANLKMVSLVVDFLTWRESRQPTGAILGADAIHDITESLHADPASDLDSLRKVLRKALNRFQASINNVAGIELRNLLLSLQGQPLKLLMDALSVTDEYRKQVFFFLLDEYENLEDYQQRVFNTLIKHSGDSNYTFKIGVKETGHRELATLNDSEYLSDPADFAHVDISDRLKENNFEEFARVVCNDRLAGTEPAVPSLDIRALLPSLGELDEAEMLGIHPRVKKLRASLESEGASKADLEVFDGLSVWMAAFIGYWAESQAVSLVEALRDQQSDPSGWATRLDNYRYSMLFTLRRGVRGIRKYYVGWETYVQLADGNIRFLLQLVGEALQRHVHGGRNLSQPVKPEVQTTAAAQVGSRALQQLPGASANGAQLTRMVLGLGRVFQIMAANPFGHAPEVTQFRLDGMAEPEAQTLLTSGVMHLALIRFPGDKMAADSGETREWNYQLHPIFAPFFVYSHRRKRKMTIRSQELVGLIEDPSRTIKAILARSNRSEDDDLPDQLSLFKGFYSESS